MKFKLLAAFAGLFSLLAFAADASAGVVLSFSNTSPTTIVAGSNVQIDVMIATDSSTTTFLQEFLAEVVLTPQTGPSGGLIFSATQSDSQLSDPNYIFSGVSLAATTGQPVGFSYSAGELYSGYDSTDDGGGGYSPVILPGLDTPALLLRLDLQAIAAGTYLIDFTSTSIFGDENGDEILFDSTPFEITVQAAPAAVPEPGSAIIFGCAMIGGLIGRRRRFKALPRLAPTPPAMREGNDTVPLPR